MEIRIKPSTSYPCTWIARAIENAYNLIYLSHAYRYNRLQRSKLDNKPFLLIRLKKFLNPHENSCSKVITILITGNILHESSTAPQQHKSVQYKWFALYLHRDVSHKDMLQPHFISCKEVSGAGGNMRGSRNFCHFYVVLILFYSLQRGSNGFIAKTMLDPYPPLDPHMGNFIITGQYLSQSRF